MRVAMLGPLDVRAEDGSPVEVTGTRLRTLLILLALDPGRVVTTSRLLDGVWGDGPPAEAVNALQALISRLRRTGFTVESRPAGYRLALDPDDVDVHRFERLAREGQAAADPVTTSTILREALALWRGPALADADGAAFAQAPVARLTELRLAATGDRIEAELTQRADLVPELESLVAEHPLHERFAGLLMRALARAGRTADALVQYTRIKTALAEELGADPSAELAALHVDLLRGDLERPPTRERTNLRSGLTSFVGRDAELARVTAMVGESRLVTLTGPGGSGKTRLAIEVGRPLTDRQPDGVWLVELASVGDGADVPQAVLTALGLRAQVLVSSSRSIGEPVETPIDRLAAALSQRAALLVLDNCEHLVAAAAALADRLLGDCPRLRILATSREPLGITGETLWPVDPLALPHEDADPATALTFPAVRLLADRARAVRPGFTVDETTAPAMVHVCRALDGMPLAIELAAARLRTMSLDQLATRLDDRFRLLTGGSRMALPRQRTLRAVVDWSWDLLDDDERTLLRRLAVFAGGATLEAVEQVCAGRGMDADVLDLLTSLVDKSLVLLVGDRYRLLETIKAYGRERLAEAGETDRVRDAFVDWFTRLATTAEPHLRRAEQIEWLELLETDHDNLHAAVRAAIASGDAAVAHRLVGHLGWYWWLHGHKVEGADLTAEVVGLPGDIPARDRALALGWAAMLAIDGIYDQRRAIGFFTRAVEVVRTEGARDHPLLRLLLALNEVLRTHGRPTEGLRTYLDVLFADDDPWVVGTARVLRAHASLNAGLLHDEAEDDFRAGLAAYRSIGERWGMSFALCSLADLLAWHGDFATAAGHYAEASRLFGELVANEDLVRYRLKLAGLHVLLGEWDRAEAAVEDAARDAEQSGMPESFTALAHARGDFARLRGEYAQARSLLTTASRQMGAMYRTQQRTVAPQFCAMIEASLGYLAAATGDLAEAVARHTDALELALESNDAPIIAQMLVGIADVARHRGDPYHAALVLGASEGVRGMRDLSVLDHARVEREIRVALTEEAFAEAYAKGLTTTLDTVRTVTDKALA